MPDCVCVWIDSTSSIYICAPQTAPKNCPSIRTEAEWWQWWLLPLLWASGGGVVVVSRYPDNNNSRATVNNTIAHQTRELASVHWSRLYMYISDAYRCSIKALCCSLAIVVRYARLWQLNDNIPVTNITHNSPNTKPRGKCTRARERE